MTLMVAAETFPVSGAAPAVPPVNLGYNCAYFLQRENGESRKDAKAPKTPVFDVIVPIAQAANKVYGGDTSNETFFRHSPLAQIDTITCPVSVYWTTADMLVPIDQVGTDWVRPFDKAKFPAGFTFDPMKLTSSKLGQTRVTDLLKPDQYDVVVIPEESIKQEIEKIKTTKVPPELAISSTKQWSITILDEGPPEAQFGHAEHPVPWSQQKFIAQMVGGKISASQLTAKKLERLMDRYAGREWLPTELKHLDHPESERSDVVRGLKTYVAAGAEHAKTFAKLYRQLPAEKQALPEKLVKELSGSGD
jgi:hypothetical protein